MRSLFSLLIVIAMPAAVSVAQQPLKQVAVPALATDIVNALIAGKADQLHAQLGQAQIFDLRGGRHAATVEQLAAWGAGCIVSSSMAHQFPDRATKSITVWLKCPATGSSSVSFDIDGGQIGRFQFGPPPLIQVTQ